MRNFALVWKIPEPANNRVLISISPLEAATPKCTIQHLAAITSKNPIKIYGKLLDEVLMDKTYYVYSDGRIEWLQ